MKRNEVIQFRVTAEEKARLRERALKAQTSIADVIREAVGFEVSEGAWQISGSRPFDDPECHQKVNRDLGDAALTKRINQLEASGTSPQRAERQARRELGL
jgi:hypothetical protein